MGVPWHSMQSCYLYGEHPLAHHQHSLHVQAAHDTFIKSLPPPDDTGAGGKPGRDALQKRSASGVQQVSCCNDGGQPS